MRYYAPWMCRFVSVDPLAHKFPYLNPYNYAGNKPISYKDLYGLQGTGDMPVDNENSGNNNQVDPGDENFGKHKEGDLVPTKEWANEDVGKRIKVNGAEYEIKGLSIENYSYYTDSDGSMRYTNRRAGRIPQSELRNVPGIDENHPDLVPIGGRAKELDFKPESDSRNVPILEKYIPPPPRQEIKRIKEKEPDPGKDPVIAPVEVPEPITTNLNLDVPFNGNRVSLRNPKAAAEVLTPILDALLIDPRNSVTLRPNTNWGQGQDIPDLWGQMGDADTSDQLVEGRGQTITKWFIDRGVHSSQIKIVIDKNNFNTTINVTGTLRMFK